MTAPSFKISRASFKINRAGTTPLEYIGPDPENNAEAKAISIQKHKIIRSFLKRRIVINTLARSTCGYCILHWNDNCENCPVRLQTGARWCENSPYTEYDRLKRMYSWADKDNEDDAARLEELIDDMIVAVTKEIEFLKSLPD